MGDQKAGIAKMSPAMYEDMLKTSPERLVTLYLMESGYAGVNRNGGIVDRRMYPDAVPMKPGGISIAPEPKPV